MGYFLKRVGQFCLLLCLVLGVILALGRWVIGYQYQEGYQGALADKLERLESIEGPKIILVGNSNVAFGFRSQMIEEAFGMPVVNLGLLGGLDNRFHEQMALRNIGPGDIVVICHTDYSDDGKVNDSTLAWTVMEWNTQYWSLLAPADWLDFARAYPAYQFNAFLQKTLGLFSDGMEGAYSRDAFNEYGDNVYADLHPEQFQFVEPTHPTDTNLQTIERLNQLNRQLAEQGAVLLIGGVPVADGELTGDKTPFYTLEQDLRSQLDCPVIYHTQDYFFPYEYFYDTNFHLNGEGARLRTQQLIQDLQQYLNTAA